MFKSNGDCGYLSLSCWGGSAFTEGYLGVEIFLPISGYLMMNGVLRQIDERKFEAKRYIVKQLKRLWAPILVGAIAALLVGYFVMLPDNYENLAESVIASSLFAENILEAITTKNYWDIVNLYKPLMHLWYIGVLFQIQFFLAIFFSVIVRHFTKPKDAIRNTVVILSIVSLLLYLYPGFSDSEKFYFPWFRTYEVLFGAMVSFVPQNSVEGKQTTWKIVGSFLTIFMLSILFFTKFGGQQLRLFSMVMCTCALLFYFRQSEGSNCKLLKCFAKIGEASYSIYIVHQIIVAYMYYCFVDHFCYSILPVYLLAVASATLFMYFFVEKKTLHFNRSLIVLPIICAFLITTSFVIYMRAGVVKNVVELDISVGDYHRGMHAEYCDNPYRYNADFKSTNKTRVLVIGNSFGRDWVNVLLESTISDDIEVSYLPYHSEEKLNGNEAVLQRRANDADLIFFVLGPDYRDIPSSYLHLISEDKLYVVGSKNFGTSNGIVYCKKNRKDYLNSTVKLDKALIDYDNQMRTKFGKKYISILDSVRVSDLTVRVFTPEGKFISQDCRHLTQNGAKYIAGNIKWCDIFGGQNE